MGAVSYGNSHELPPHLQQDFILRRLIPPKQDFSLDNIMLLDIGQHDKGLLHECLVIVTTRPISSGDLHPVVSSRIEVLGFTQAEQRLYFTECFKGDTKALEALLESIEENAVVQSACYTPLDAAFVVRSYMFKGQILPNSLYEIYLTVILECIQQHFKWEGRDDKLVSEVKILHDFSKSEAVREPFRYLCELAYHGVMENKIAFLLMTCPRDTIHLDFSKQ